MTTLFKFRLQKNKQIREILLFRKIVRNQKNGFRTYGICTLEMQTLMTYVYSFSKAYQVYD